MGSYFTSSRSELDLETSDQMKAKISRLNEQLSITNSLVVCMKLDIDSLHKQLENGGLRKKDDFNNQCAEEKKIWQKRFEKEKRSLKFEFDKEMASLANEIELKRKELYKYCQIEMKKVNLNFQQNLLDSCKQEANNFLEQLANYKEESFSEEKLFSSLKTKIIMDISLLKTILGEISAWQIEKSKVFEDLKNLMIQLISTQIDNEDKFYTTQHQIWSKVFDTIEEEVKQKVSSLLKTQYAEINAIKSDIDCEINKINNEVSSIKLQVSSINELNKIKEQLQIYSHFKDRPAELSFNDRPAEFLFSKKPAELNYNDSPTEIYFNDRPAEFHFNAKPTEFNFGNGPAEFSFNNRRVECRFNDRPEEFRLRKSIKKKSKSQTDQLKKNTAISGINCYVKKSKIAETDEQLSDTFQIQDKVETTQQFIDNVQNENSSSLSKGMNAMRRMSTMVYNFFRRPAK